MSLWNEMKLEPTEQPTRSMNTRTFLFHNGLLTQKCIVNFRW